MFGQGQGPFTPVCPPSACGPGPIVPIAVRIGDDWSIPFVLEDSGIAGVSVSDPTLFTGPVSVIIAPPLEGRQATATSAIVGGLLVVTVTDPGTGYSQDSPPAVTLGGGTTATATAQVGNPISGVGANLSATIYQGGLSVPLVGPAGSVSWTNATAGQGVVAVTPATTVSFGVGQQAALSVTMIDTAGKRHTLDPIALLPVRPQDFVDTLIQPPMQVLTVAGTQGVSGPVGPGTNITIGRVDTLQPGAPASLTMRGSPPSLILDAGIPQGQPGGPFTLDQVNAAIADALGGLTASSFDLTSSANLISI